MFSFWPVLLLTLMPMAFPSSGAAEDLGPPHLVSAETIPVRPPGAPTGSEFARSTIGWQGKKRQAAAVDELLRGNVPDFLRTLKPVRLSHTGEDGVVVEALVWVSPDYLAIGSDDDFLYMPLTLPSAATVANAWGFVLPTRKMVDAIYAQSEFYLAPVPMEPGPKMRSSVYYLRHQQLIDAQREEIPLGALLSGHKKDVVLTNRLAAKLGRIAIYGWHRKDGKPIQPLSTVHGQRYADYSHGIRLVWNRVWIDGKLRSIYDVLKTPLLAPALTYEGAIRTPRKLMHMEGEPWGD